MKRNIAFLLVVAALAGVPAAFIGCAVTQGQETANSYAKDKEIAARIKTALYADPVAKGTQIEVKSLNGTVQLSGFTDTEESKRKAEEIAANTPGVREVVNNILLPTGRLESR